jgi:small subunit ribosomal protein S13
MARITGVELPSDKKILYALPVLYGVGSALAEKIVEAAHVSPDKRVKDLSEDETQRLQKEVENWSVEGDLRRLVTQNIKRLEEIGSYRGIRHKKGLPARGQRTRSNARTKRGRRQTVGAMKKELRAQSAKQATQSQEKK